MHTCIIFKDNAKDFFITSVPERAEEDNVFFKNVFHYERLPEDFDINKYAQGLLDIRADNKRLTIREIGKSFELLKAEKLAACTAYGNSFYVDATRIGDKKVVVNSELRMKLRERFQVLSKAGRTEDTLRFEELQIRKPIGELEIMLGGIALRAVQNYDTLQGHLTAIRAITEAEKLQAYDFTTGYYENENQENPT